MSISLTVYVSTKNTDLHAVSAFEALHHIMGFSDLSSLRRYRVLNLTFDCSTKEEALALLDEMVAKSFDLLNPNKEAFVVDEVPSSGHAVSFLVDVRAKASSATTSDSVSHFRSRHNIPLTAFESGIVWELGFASGTSYSESEILEKFVWSSSSTQGLLAHPVQDTVTVLSSVATNA